MDERVQREVSALAPSGVTTRAVAFPDRKYATWLGGSVMGALRTFPSMWVTKNEYDDYGASIVHRKTF
jgi:actin